MTIATAWIETEMSAEINRKETQGKEITPNTTQIRSIEID